MKNKFAFFMASLAGALCMMCAAFYNGFPIVYSDTSTYLASGFELQTPFDRPITYGLFLRLASLNGFSLWLVIFFQCFLLSVLLFLTVKKICGDKNSLLYGLISIALLSFFSGLSWTASQVMPDIFTPIALLSLVLILLGGFSKPTNIFLYFVFFLAVAMHMSHVLLFALLIVILFLLKRKIFNKNGMQFRPATFILLIVLVLASIVTMGSAMSKSKHVFFMGAMVEHGIVKAYLDEHCGDHTYKLCAYKDSLPARAYTFIWDKNSPFYKIGGWKETKKEFNEIIYGTLTQSKYIGLHLKASVKASADQLIHFGIGDGNGSFLKGTLLDDRIALYFPNALAVYENSRQNRAVFGSFEWINLFYAVVVGCSFLLLIVFYFSKKMQTQELKITTIIILTGILINAWDCGTFANAIDRLGCKVTWLLPFLLCLYGIKRLQEKRNTNA